MIGIHSPFRQYVYNMTDRKSKIAVARHLMKLGHYVYTLEWMGPDVMAFKSSNGVYSWHEAEMRDHFNDKGWRFTTIHVPARKERLQEIDLAGRGFYWALSNDYKQAMVMKMEDVYQSTPIEVPNTREPSGEYFYDVPLSAAKLVCML